MATTPTQLEVDSVDRDTWVSILNQFDDACLDQTWPYATAARSDTEASHILLKRGSELVAACQTSIRRVPLLNLPVADVRWGPLICRRGLAPESEVILEIVRALKREYGIKRRCFLRISPHVMGPHRAEMQRVLEAEGFRADLSERPYRTLMLDLSPPLAELRANLLPRWRRHLNKAEKNDVVLVEGVTDELFQIFLNLSVEMRERKNLQVDYQRYRNIQQDLPDAHKMNVIVCQHAGRPVAAVVGSAFGRLGIYLLGATGQEGLGLDASYLAHWRLIEWLKAAGVRYYDLGAINPALNPGGYFFKQGIAGKTGWDETFLHSYEGCFSLRSRIARLLLTGRRLLQRRAKQQEN